MINSLYNSSKLRDGFLNMKLFFVAFCMLVFVGVNAQVTVNVTNATSVNANDGLAIANVATGSGNYTYYWEDLSTNLPANGPTTTTASTDTFFNAPSGTYLLSVIDNGLSTFSSDTVFISAPGGSFSYNGALGLCINTTTQLTAILSGCSYINPTLGTDYTLLSSAGGVLLSTNSTLDSVSLPVLGAGTYYMSSANLDNGCITVDTFTISTGVLSSNVVSSNVLGPNNLGSATITAFGGTPPYSIYWSIGGVGSVITSWTNGDTIQNLNPGTYTYTVSSAGCFTSGSVTITNACNANFISNYNVCDESINLSATMNMTNPGSSYNYNYELSNSSGVIENLLSSNDSITFTSSIGNNGLYFLNVTETITGCISQDTIDINLTPLLVNTTVNNVTDPLLCNGSIFATPTTGSFPYTFQWDTNGTIFSSNSGFNSSIINLCSDTFCLTVTDASSCTYNECIAVQFNPCIATTTVFDSINCYNGVGVIQVDVDTLGLGAGPLAYAGSRFIYTVTDISTSATTTQQSNNTTFIFPNLSAGSYIINVEDQSWGSFCVGDTIELTQPDPLQIFTSTYNPSFPWIQDGYIVIDSIIGGTAPFNVVWLDSVGIPLPTSGFLVQDSLGYSNQYNGGYTIQVTDTNGCFQSVTLYLDPDNSASQLSIDSISVTNPRCFDDCDGKLFAKMYGVGTYSVPPFTFYWLNATTGDTLKVDSLGSAWYNPAHVATYTNRCAGDYELHAYDYYDRGPTTAQFTLTNPDQISVYTYGGEPLEIECGKDTVLVSQVFGGNRTNDTIFHSTNIIQITGSSTAYGFSDTLDVGGDYLLQVSGFYNDTGGVFHDAAYRDFISPSPEMNWSFDGNFTHRPTPNQYDLTHTYYFPFTGTGVHEFIFFDPGLIYSGDLIFTIFELELDTPQYTYIWYESTPAGNIVISDSSTAYSYPGVNGTDYILSVEDHKGCEAIDSLRVEWNLNILNFNNVSVVSASCYGDSSGSVVMSVDSSTGFPPYSYLIDGVVTTDTVFNLPQGNYTLTLADSIGCISDDYNVSILQPDSLYACGVDTNKVAVLLDSFTMSFDSSYSHTTQVSTMPGLEYMFRVSGVFGDTLFVNYMDAAYIYNVAPPIAHNYNPWQFNGDSTIRPIPDIFNPNHVYEYYFIGDGNPQTFTYEDLAGDYLGSGGQLNFEFYKLVCPVKDTSYSCFGDSTATASVYPNGGIPFDPDGISNSGDEYYKYEWTGAGGTIWSTSQTANNLPAGNYTVTITDSLGCTYERELLVLQSATPLNIDSISQIDVACKSDSTGEILAVVSGGFGSNVAVLVSGNDTVYLQTDIADTILITNLKSGLYDLYVFDTIPNSIYGLYGCPQQAQIFIDEPQNELTSTVNLLENVICFGDSTGKAISNVQGGQFPYIYAWDNGDSTQINSNLWAGWQGVTFTDANNCTLRDSIEIINVNPEIQGFVSILQNVSCFNGCDGIAQLSSTGGVLQHNYFWDNGQTYFGSGPDTAYNLCYGGHDIIIEDMEGCRKIIEFTINQPTEIFAQATMVQPVQCFGFDDGMAYGTATGGTPPYTYVWDSINGQSGQNAINLTPGVHVLYVTDSKGCTAQDTVVITEPAELIVSIDDTMTVYSYCSGTNSGQLCAVASGGTTPYNYVWNDPLGQQGSCAFNLQADFYTVIVMDDRNCIATTSFDLDSITNSMTSAGVSTSQNDVTCFGLYDGSITINLVTGGIPGYSYQWTGPSGYTSTDSSISSLYSGSYACVITDTNGCAVTINTELYQPDQLEYNTYNVADVSCFGACNGQIWVDVEGGTWPYYYDFSETGTFPIATANKVQLISDTLIKDLCTGQHSIYITDANNCVGTVQWGGTWQEFVDSGVVVVNDNINTVDATCFNSNDGYAWIPWPGPNPLFTYTWETDPITSTIDTGSSTNLLFPGNYNLVAHYSDSANFGQVYSGCDVALPFTISGPPAIVSGGIVTDVTCYTDTDGQITLNPSGGTGTFSFLWDTTTSVPIGSNQINSQNLNNLQPGTYTVTITDANGCDITQNFDVLEPDALTNDFINVSDVTCFNLQDGSVTSQPDGGTPGYSFSWSPSGGNAAIANNLTAGTYTLTVTDANGCQGQFSVDVNQPDQIIASTDANAFYGEDQNGNPYNISCIGLSDGSAIVINGGGLSPINYSWVDATGNVVSTNANTGNILSAGNYTITVTDANGCSEIDNITLIEPTQLLANPTESGDISNFPGAFDISCKGESDGWIELDPSGGVANSGGIYQYSWNGSINGPMNMSSIYNLTAGNYSVTVTDANGCSITEIFNLDEPADDFVATVDFVNYTGPQKAPYQVNFIDNTSTLNNDLINHYWYWSVNESVDSYFNSNQQTFTNTFNTVGDNFVYVIVENTISGCTDSLTFNVEVQGIDDPINNVFTPNGDGINDTYDFGEHAMSVFNVEIYNRWGETVFSWEGEKKVWDGKGYDGQMLPEGVYFYIMEAEGIDGEFYSEKGTVTLIR